LVRSPSILRKRERRILSNFGAKQSKDLIFYFLDKNKGSKVENPNHPDP